MSEQLSKNHDRGEQEPNPYGTHSPEHSQPAHTPEHDKPQKNEIDNLLKKIERQAETAESIEAKQSQHGHYLRGHQSTGHAKPRAHTPRQIEEVQKRLNKPERQFSRFIHNPTVEALSDGAGATVARPSGLFMGGLFSFLASIIVVIVCRYYGYEYNYTIALGSFIGGFALGLIVELVAKAFSSKKR